MTGCAASPKLVRDRIPAIIRASGEHPVTTTASPSGFRDVLCAKLREEAGELAAARTPAEMLGEIADVLEVLRAIGEHAGITPGQAEEARAAKERERGGFAGRVIWHGNTTAGRA